MTFYCSSCAITDTVKECNKNENIFHESKFIFITSVISNSCYLEAVNLIKYHKLKADVLHLIATHVSIITWITPF
jgi:hypothetical protein